MPSPSFVLGATTLFFSFISSASSQQYINPDIYSPSNFFSKFDFFTGDDPTHGFVDYLSQSAAQNTPGMLSQTSTYARFGAEHSTKVAAGARGRKSVRLESSATYTKGLFIADIQHMPNNACGAWPAFWTFGPNWPSSGEIDIIENVNFATNNQYTLHSNGPTGGSCSITSQPMNGTLGPTDCAVEDANGNIVNTAGCSIVAQPNRNNYGDAFNAIGGGVYVMQWTSTHINMWFFQRNNIPASLKSTTVAPSLCEFGRPDASFAGCNFDTYFKQHKIIFTNTFCGDWAGATGVYPSGTKCPSSCSNEVGTKFNNYANSYWQVNSLRVWSENPAVTDHDSLLCAPRSSSSSSSSSTRTSSSSSSTKTSSSTLTTSTKSSSSISSASSTKSSSSNSISATSSASPSVSSSSSSSAASSSSSTASYTIASSSASSINGVVSSSSIAPSSISVSSSASSFVFSLDSSSASSSSVVFSSSISSSTISSKVPTSSSTANPSTKASSTVTSSASSKPISPDSTCGGAKGYTCLTGECCSQYGWCGTSKAYCGTGCQKGFGLCT